LLIALFMLTIIWMARRNASLFPAGKRADMAARLREMPGLFEAFALFALVVGGLAAGAFTPTEAGSAGSVLALLLGLARRKLSFSKLVKAVFETMNVSAMIFLLLAGAGCYGKFLAVSRTPFMVAEWVARLQVAPVAVLALVLLVYFIGGMFMDALALLLITLPIFFPLIRELGIDPLWFSLLLLVITTMGAMTPPVGASAYVVASMGAIPLGDVFRGTLIFMPAFIICLAIMYCFPGFVLFLPNMTP
jgi:tripartite ATP-independent transporter DctM subunit